MKCLFCKKDLNEFDDYIIMGDGDACCNDDCKKKYEDKRDYFINNVLTDDKKFNEWIMG